MEHSASSCLVVFAKAPTVGQVKRRLIPAIGAQAACQLHEYLLRHGLHLALSSGLGAVQLWGTPDIQHHVFQSLQRQYPITLHTQQGQDLGMRMYNAFEEALKDYRKVLLMGTDCPFITPSLITRSVNALNGPNSAVIVPAHDGGYMLLGLTRNDRRLFDDIAWGTDRVFKDTLAKLDRYHYQWQVMEMLHDVDRYEDLLYLKDNAESAGLSQEAITFLGELTTTQVKPVSSNQLQS